jgi:hypothetical protein
VIWWLFRPGGLILGLVTMCRPDHGRIHHFGLGNYLVSLSIRHSFSPGSDRGVLSTCSAHLPQGPQ